MIRMQNRWQQASHAGCWLSQPKIVSKIKKEAHCLAGSWLAGTARPSNCDEKLDELIMFDM